MSQDHQDQLVIGPTVDRLLSQQQGKGKLSCPSCQRMTYLMTGRKLHQQMSQQMNMPQKLHQQMVLLQKLSQQMSQLLQVCQKLHQHLHHRVKGLQKLHHGMS